MTDTASLESTALDLIRQAIAEDQKQNFPQAYQLYKSAIAVMIRAMKCILQAAETNPRLKTVLEKKTNEWLVRAEKLKQFETQADFAGNYSSADPSQVEHPSTFDQNTLLQQVYSLYQAAVKADEEQCYEQACGLYLEGVQQLDFALQCKS